MEYLNQICQIYWVGVKKQLPDMKGIKCKMLHMTLKDKEIEFTVYAGGEVVFYYNNQEYILSPNKEMKFIFMKNGI